MPFRCTPLLPDPWIDRTFPPCLAAERPMHRRSQRARGPRPHRPHRRRRSTTHADLSVARRLHGGGVVWFEADRGSRHCRRRLRGIRREEAPPTNRRSSPTGPSSRRTSATSSKARTWPTRSTATSSTAVALPTSCASAVTMTASQSRAPVAHGELPVGEGKPGLVVKALESGAAGDAHHGRDRRRVRARREQRSVQVDRRSAATRSRRPSTTSRCARVANNVATRVKAESKLISVEEVRGAARWSCAEDATRQPARRRRLPDVRCRSSAADYVGDSSDRTGFGGLEAIDEVTMLCVPDLTAALERGMIDVEGFKAVQLAMIAHCELMADRVAILDPPPGAERAAGQGVARRHAGYDSKYATLYWPRLKVMDPTAGQGDLRPAVRSHRRHLGPQRRHPRRAQGTGQRGHPRRDLAGAATSPRASTISSTRSPSTASARSRARASASGALARCRAIPSGATSTCAACSTSSRSRSCRARTGSCSSRTTRSCGTRSGARSPCSCAVSGVTARCSAATPAEAFFVKCDEENNPPENRDAGILTVEIGIAPVKPAEFVVFRISQFSGGAGLEE